MQYPCSSIQVSQPLGSFGVLPRGLRTSARVTCSDNVSPTLSSDYVGYLRLVYAELNSQKFLRYPTLSVQRKRHLLPTPTSFLVNDNVAEESLVDIVVTNSHRSSG